MGGKYTIFYESRPHLLTTNVHNRHVYMNNKTKHMTFTKTQLNLQDLKKH